MLSAYANIARIPELRKRVLFTMGILALCRVSTNIPCPGVDPEALAQMFGRMNSGGGGMLDMLNLFSGGALQRFAVGALGIMPYISASIIMQLMTPVIPTLEKMVREGESGRQKYQQISRYVTVIICIIQGTMFATAMMNLPSGEKVVFTPGLGFVIRTVITLTAGAMLLMWFGEMITERGIGNGASLIITVNILSRLPQAVVSLYTMVRGGAVSGGQEYGIIHVLLLLGVFFLVCMGAVALTQGHRKVPIRYAKRTAGRTGAPAGSTSYLPLRVNYSGVMPIIFAGAILMFLTMGPRWLAVQFPDNWLLSFINQNMSYASGGYMFVYGMMILLFCFFWVANQFNPVQIADNLQKSGGYVPGIRPGQPTAEFLETSMTRITIAGAIFLTGLAVIPMLLTKQFDLPQTVSQFFGGTSLLIMVGVVLDTMRQVETHLMSNHYDGFLSKGKLRSRQR
ncbi:MAG: preprotein translocase subunit SecY [Lentisphaeria bacterium]|nr:preprotein translocase subunit SecY [Lentisphaeria bacterium]